MAAENATSCGLEESCNKATLPIHRVQLTIAWREYLIIDPKKYYWCARCIIEEKKIDGVGANY